MESFTEILDKIGQEVDITLAAIAAVHHRPGDKNNSKLIRDSNDYEDI
jgi:hypothetical protein